MDKSICHSKGIFFITEADPDLQNLIAKTLSLDGRHYQNDIKMSLIIEKELHENIITNSA